MREPTMFTGRQTSSRYYPNI